MDKTRARVAQMCYPGNDRIILNLKILHCNFCNYEILQKYVIKRIKAAKYSSSFY